ncbi:MAG: SMI1/KNR4 family protein [Gemmataceae bacterium]
MNATGIEDLLVRLETWLQKNRPEYFVQLQPGASLSEIESLEQEIGASLPEELCQLFLWHNGQRGEMRCFQFGYVLLGVEGSLEQHRELDEINVGILRNDPSSTWWSTYWVPILDDGTGDLLCVAAKGLFGGSPGQIVPFVHDDAPGIIEYPSIRSWLDCFVQSLELGMWQEEGARFDPIDRGAYDQFLQNRVPGFPKTSRC